MSTPKKTPDNRVHVVEVGAITIDIFRGATRDGHTYLYYQPTRMWRMGNSPRLNSSDRFYERNEKDLTKAVKDTSEWIRKNSAAADPSWHPTPTAVSAPSQDGHTQPAAMEA